MSETTTMKAVVDIHIERFNKDLNDLGIDYSMELSDWPKAPKHTYRVKITAKYRDNPQTHNRQMYALMGVIAHFNNRKWIKDWSYIYIMKDMHTIVFNEAEGL
jgi:hypothetical protein